MGAKGGTRAGKKAARGARGQYVPGSGSPLLVRCPTCAAEAGQSCVSSTLRRKGEPCVGRKRLAAGNEDRPLRQTDLPNLGV
jgi:hypothetical protein